MGDYFIKSIHELVAAVKERTVALGAQKVKHCEASEFKKNALNTSKDITRF